MIRASSVAGLLSVFVASSCTGSSPPEPSNPKTSAAVVPALPVVQARLDVPPAPSGEQWACKQDSDCTMTCALGSVSSAWIKSRPNADDCDDGCGWSSGQEACRDGECVALAADGTINSGCTHRTKSPYD